jgi:tRNA(fMet)-specific endonuclease VapC
VFFVRSTHACISFQFLIPLVIADSDEGAAEAYGKVLEGQGKPIGALDTLIAAHALSLKATLVVHFKSSWGKAN